MLQEHINLLTIRPLHLLLSSRTKKAYIDKNNCCYLFETRSDGDAFAASLENVYLKDAEYHKQLEFCTGFYSMGIDAIKVKLRENKSFLNIPVQKEDAKKQYFNRDAVRLVLRLKQTGRARYLRELKDSELLTPVLIDERQETQCPNIHYSYIIHNGENCYLAFTTIQAYNEWAKAQNETWQPLKMKLRNMDRIRKKSPVIINVMDDRLLLTDKLIKKMETEK